MSFRDPCRSSLRKRKQLSIDGTVAGIEYNRSLRRYNPSQFDHALRLDLPHSAQAYDPDPGQPDYPESQYEPYEWDVRAHATPPIRFEMPSEAHVEGPPPYDASLMTDGLFQRLMQERASSTEPNEPMPFQNEVGMSIAAPESLDQIIAEPPQADPVSEIEAAIDQQMQQMEMAFAEPMQEPEQQPPPEPPPEQMYEEPWMMNPFGMPGMGPMM